MSNFIQSIVNGFTTVTDKLVNLKDAITALNNIYVSKSDLNAPFNPPSLDANGMIRGHQIPQSAMPLKQVADIATRDALTNLPSPCQVYVVDASADGVTGGAYYLYTSENGYVKTSNAGDVQLEVDYLDIKNKPLVFTPDVHYHSEYVSKNDKSSYLKNIKINNQLATVIDNVANITIDVQQVTTSAGNVDLSLYAFKTHHHDDLYARYDYLLDQAGKFKADLMPKITISDTFDVNNQVQMLGLACEKGDMARRMDFTPPKMYVLQGDNPAVLSNWIELTVSTDITATINSQKGIAGGLATLGADGKVPLSQLPPLGSSSASSLGASTVSTTLGLLHFDGSNGSSNIIDQYGHAITKIGSPILSNAQSVFGDTSLYLNGSSAIDIDGLTGLNSNTYFSIDCFIRLEQLGVSQSIGGIYDSFTSAGWSFSVSSGNKLRFYNSVTNTFVDSQTALIANKTYHVAMLRKNNTVSIFIDSEFAGSMSVNATIGSVTNYKFCIGSLSNTRQGFLKGWIDEYRIVSYSDIQTFSKPTVAYTS